VKNKKFLSAVLISSLVFLFVAASVVFAKTATEITDTTITSMTKVVELIETVGTWFQMIVLAIAVIMIIYAGLLWMIAGGDEEKLGKARKMLIYGVVGIAVAIFAYGAVTLVNALV